MKLKTQQTNYISQLGKADTPDLTKSSGKPRQVEVIEDWDFSRPSTAPRPSTTRQVARTAAVPRTCKLNVTNPKIAQIYSELRSLRLAQHPHAIAVLLRVFLETSLDHYLTKVSIPLSVRTGGGDKDKNLRKKLEETIDYLVKQGAPRKDFAGVVRGINVSTHPFSMELLHSYVHNRFVSPTERDLTAAWDSAQPLFERIWP